MTANRHIDHTECGFYKLSLAKGAPDVGAIIFRPCPIEMHHEYWNYLDRSAHKEAMINGRPCEVWKIPDYAERIEQAEYEFLIADRKWAANYDSESPEANPYRRVETPKKAPKQDAKPKMKITDVPINDLRP